MLLFMLQYVLTHMYHVKYNSFTVCIHVKICCVPSHAVTDMLPYIRYNVHLCESPVLPRMQLHAYYRIVVYRMMLKGVYPSNGGSV